MNVLIVVRGFGYKVTHLALVPSAALEPASWPSPRHTFTGVRTPVVAVCGRQVRSCQPVVVVMLPGAGARLRCRECVRVAKAETPRILSRGVSRA
jgi:hypothetical protein